MRIGKRAAWLMGGVGVKHQIGILEKPHSRESHNVIVATEHVGIHMCTVHFPECDLTLAFNRLMDWCCQEHVVSAMMSLEILLPHPQQHAPILVIIVGSSSTLSLQQSSYLRNGRGAYHGA